MAEKALLSGINDYKTLGDLRGCINDTHSIHDLLVSEFGFDDKSIRSLTDSNVTKSKLTKGWKWLLRDAQPGDRLVFHFSGHGSYTADRDGDEDEDGRDELLCLYGMDWDDPTTYLLDDELRSWTAQIPEGVAVTFLLDCCHSGTGTRFVEPELSRAAETDFRSAASLSIDRVAEARTRAFGGVRAVGSAAADQSGVRPASHRDINERTVLARYAPPPAEIQIAIDKAKRKSTFRDALRQTRTRGGADQAMNHVLWSGCRSDQTSADAYIGGDYHGAFTYHFCRTVRERGADADVNVISSQVRESLRSENFQQVPQLEPGGTRGAVFGMQKPSGPSGTAQATADSDSPSTSPSPAQWDSLLASLQDIASHLRGAPTGPRDLPLASGRRSLVFVHGICLHKPGFSNGWWDSIAAHLSPTTRQSLAGSRHEVLWSRHVTETTRAVEAAKNEPEQYYMELMLREILQERAAKEAEAQMFDESRSASVADFESGIQLRSADRPTSMSRAMLGIPGLDCVDDFVKYLTIDSVRQAVIAEFTSTVRPLLERGESVDVISHSWGTVVAFEALRALEQRSFPGRVRNWFTVGAALAIAFVAQRLRPGDGRKPAMVDDWINVNARGDAVGGSLQPNSLQVDREYLKLTPVDCDAIFGLVSPACAHSSYFQPSNAAVNRDIFARWIEQS